MRWCSCNAAGIATSCHDYPRPYDLAAPPATRRAQYKHALAQLDLAQFRPFSPAAWLGTEIDAINSKPMFEQLCHDQALTCTYDQHGLVNIMKDATETRQIEIVIFKRRVMRRQRIPIVRGMAHLDFP